MATQRSIDQAGQDVCGSTDLREFHGRPTCAVKIRTQKRGGDWGIHTANSWDKICTHKNMGIIILICSIFFPHIYGNTWVFEWHYPNFCFTQQWINSKNDNPYGTHQAVPHKSGSTSKTWEPGFGIARIIYPLVHRYIYILYVCS